MVEILGIARYMNPSDARYMNPSDDNHADRFFSTGNDDTHG